MEGERTVATRTHVELLKDRLQLRAQRRVLLGCLLRQLRLPRGDHPSQPPCRRAAGGSTRPRLASRPHHPLHGRSRLAERCELCDIA